MFNKVIPIFIALSICAFVGVVNAGEPTLDPKPPIEIPLELERDSYVTLVIEDDKGTRVRNLVSETFYKAGKHTLYWDGMDDHGRANIGPHGNYTTTGSIVTPGKYKVRGITRDKIDLVYEFSPYNPNNLPWRTADASGQWLADHTPPSSVLYVPGTKPFMLIGSSLAEGAHGLVWTDLNGKKIRGVQGIGGGWAGAVRLKLDAAGQPETFVAYGLGASRYGQISLVGIGERSNKTLFTRQEKVKHHKGHYIVDYPVGGLAVYKGLAAISYPDKNEIVFIEIDPKATLKEPSFRVKLTNPKGLAFDEQGRFYVLADNALKRYRIDDQQLVDEEVMIADGLDDPIEILIHSDGHFFISDHGNSHQVKVFNAEGKALYSIGKPGKPVCGPYSETKMQHPVGMTLTPEGELWVAEEDYQPKRVSVWTRDGKFKKAFYGQVEYGGGGKIDPTDKSRFYYFGMEFKLDWEKGTDKIVNIFYRRDNPVNLHIPNKNGDLTGNPETPIYLNGRQYMTNTYTARPTMGPLIAGVWVMDKGTVKPVAAVGQANYWDIFKSEEYKSKIPAGINLNAPTNQQWTYDRKPPYENALIFAWSDLNGDHQIQSEEVQFRPGKVGGLNQNNLLDFYTADGLEIKVERTTKTGVPIYDLKKAARVCSVGVPLPYNVVIPGRNGDFAVNGIAEVPKEGKPLASVSGITKGGKRWTYPNQWCGLHASQSYPINRTPKPGDIIGTTKVISPSFTVAGGKEELWALNANSGQIYLFTIDGLFVSSLFKHGYFSDPYPLKAERGMLMNNYTSDGEGFWQTITATDDGKVYVQAMNHTNSIMRLDGLNSIERIEPLPIDVSKQHLDECLQWFSKAENARQLKQGKKKAKVLMTSKPPVVDGDLSDWLSSEWLNIDDRTLASFRISNGTLFAAWKTLHKNLIQNSGADPWQGMFKTGGALDIMISNTGNDTRNPKVGDQRILISKVNGAIRAIQYEQVSERRGHPGKFSANRTVKFDHILDVSSKVRLAEGRVRVPYHDTNVVFGTKVQMRSGYAYEVAIPLSVLGLEQKPPTLTGDIGVLLGNGTTTIKRLYWSNKNTVMLFDAPEESLLKPSLWGKLELIEHEEKSFIQSISDRGDEVDVLSQGIGDLSIDSLKVERAEPSAVIEWSGKGLLQQRRIGRKGYVVFRNRAEGWFDDVPPLVNLAEGFQFVPYNPGRFKDGLYAGCRAKVLQMSIDGKNCGEPKKIFGALLWAKQKSPQSASWDISTADDQVHQLTTLHGIGAAMKLTLAPLNDPDNKRTIVEFDGSEGMSVVQFSFRGSVRLSLEQTAYTAEEIKNNRPAANITAIFID